VLRLREVLRGAPQLLQGPCLLQQPGGQEVAAQQQRPACCLLLQLLRGW
jgi:hypothetical protein